MRRRSLIVCCGLLMLLVGVAGASGAGLPADVSVRVTLTDRFPPKRTQVFSLTCNPPAGTLPLADRVCELIRGYRAAMLAPRPVGPTIICTTIPGTPDLTVVATSGGKTTTFGRGYCNNPDGMAAGVYLAAIDGDRQALESAEIFLRCDEDPYFLGRPTTADVGACMGGMWTTHTEDLIRIAKKALAIAALGPAELFPARVGAHTCTLRASERTGGRPLRARCGVIVNDFSTEAVVTFLEYRGHGDIHYAPWSYKGFSPLGNLTVREPSKRRNWLVTIKDGRVVSVLRTGAGAPPAPCPRCQPHP